MERDKNKSKVVQRTKEEKSFQKLSKNNCLPTNTSGYPFNKDHKAVKPSERA